MQAKYIGIIIIALLVGVGGYFLLRGGYQTQVPAPTPKETAIPGKQT